MGVLLKVDTLGFEVIIKEYVHFLAKRQKMDVWEVCCLICERFTELEVKSAYREKELDKLQKNKIRP